MTALIALSERGWIEIDSATVRTSGDVHAVIAEMQATLEQPEVICLCSRLGIHSAGFMFFDRFTRMTRFFGRDEGPPPTYSTRYISPTSSVSVDDFEGIHQLFLLIRGEQASWARARHIDPTTTPDYFRYLPRAGELCSLVPEETNFRERYAVHYCTLGEMVVTSALWRGLSRLQQAKLGHLRLEDDLADRLAHLSNPTDLQWKGIKVFEHLLGIKGGDALRDRWTKEFGLADTWNEDLRALGVTGPNAAIIRTASNTFCDAICRDRLPVSASDARDFTHQSFLALLPLLQILEPGCAPTSVDDALAALERLARFPLLPFFVWNALEVEPHVYCIVPVWTSQGYPFIENHHLGFALTALRPNLELDWSIRACGATRLTSDVDPLIITSLLRLAARPLVEHSLYGRLVKQAEHDEERRSKAEIRRKLGRLTRKARRRR